jgi:hypothetical protein
MGFLSDLLLAGGAFGAAVFCLVLSRRLRALTTLDGGMGTAISVLSAQVDDLTRALRSAQEAAQGISGRLVAQTDRAEAAARQLELLVAALHDLPGAERPAGLAQRDGAPAAPPTSPAPDPMAGLRPAVPSDPADAEEAALPRARILRRRSIGHAA